MDTMGASHSMATARHFSSGTMSLRLVEYSRMRPQPVQVRLHVCSGSSCKTIANFGVLRSLCLMIWLAIFFVSAKGKRINGFKAPSYDYRAEAISTGVFASRAGALVCGGSAFRMPGIKKSSGETVLD